VIILWIEAFQWAEDRWIDLGMKVMVTGLGTAYSDVLNDQDLNLIVD